MVDYEFILNLKVYVLELSRQLLSDEDIEHSEQTIIKDAGLVKTDDDGVLTFSSRDHHENIRHLLRKTVCSGNVKKVEELFRTIGTLGAAAEQPSWCSGSVPHDIRNREDGPATHQLHTMVDASPQLSPKSKRRPLDGSVAAKAGKECPDTIANDIGDECAYVNRQPNAARSTLSTKQLVNYVYECPCAGATVRATLVHYAILAGCMEMLTCLVRWGTDVSTTLKSQAHSKRYAKKSFPLEFSCLSLAVHLGLPRMVEQLLALGQSPHHTSLQINEVELACSKCGSWDVMTSCTCQFTDPSRCAGDGRTCLALWSYPSHPPPATAVFSCTYWRPEVLKYEQILIPYYRWDAECAELAFWGPDGFEVEIASYKKLLATPCFTKDELVCKKFVCALMLQRMVLLQCLDRDPNNEETPEEIQKYVTVIRCLIQHGANPSGLSALEAGKLCHDWLQVKQREMQCRNVRHQPFSFENRGDPVWLERLGDSSAFPVLANCVDAQTMVRPYFPQRYRYWHIVAEDARTYFSYAVPPAVCRILNWEPYFEENGDAYDELVKLLVDQGGIPGIQSTHEIPFAGGRLHNGPSCQCDGVVLSAAQRRVSVKDLVRPAPQPRSLLHLCRSAVINACQWYGPVAAIAKLDLPPLLRSFLQFE
eukprot:scpid60760/ scgid27543/ 